MTRRTSVRSFLSRPLFTVSIELSHVFQHRLFFLEALYDAAGGSFQSYEDGEPFGGHFRRTGETLPWHPCCWGHLSDATAWTLTVRNGLYFAGQWALNQAAGLQKLLAVVSQEAEPADLHRSPEIGLRTLKMTFCVSCLVSLLSISG